MSVREIEALFEEVGVRRWSDLVERNIQVRTIARAIEEGVIRRPVMRKSLGPVPGILVSPEANVDGMRDAAIAMLLTHGEGTLYGQTAGKLLRLTDSLPPTLGILIPHRITRMPRQVTFDARRCRNGDLLTAEVDQQDTDLGVRVRITSLARTVADLLHMGRRDADDYRAGITALSRFLAADGEPGEVLRLVARLYPDSYEHAAGLANAAHEMMATGTRRGDEDGDAYAGGGMGL